jgi:hypothetical protein
MMLLRKKSTVAISTAALLAAGGAAYAWSTTAVGSGGGGTGTVSPVEFTNDEVKNIWPGSPVPIAVKYHNPNPGQIDVKLTPKVDSVVHPNGPCPANKFTITPATELLTGLAPNADFQPAAGQPGYTQPSVTLASDAPDTCQGVSVTISYVNP